MVAEYNPPFEVTPAIVEEVALIAERIGRLAPGIGRLRLRRINRIRTIHGTLAIEGNALSEEQVTAVLDGKPVIAPPRERQEVRNALVAYDALTRWEPTSEENLLAAHRLLMGGLIEDAGS
jgi:Fic family protein